MPPILVTENLTKDYVSGWIRRRRYRAVERLSLEVQEGEIFGLLGPNGAGKTTTIKLLLHLLRPTSGSVRIFGRSPEDLTVRAQVGFLPEHPYLPDVLTARELLDYFGRLFGLSRAERAARMRAVLDRVGFRKDLADRPLRQLSRGERVRVGLAQALLQDPKLLILDDPMDGLDPMGRRHLRELMLSLREEGKTIFFSAPLVAEAETLCDRVALLSRGRLLACGSPAALTSAPERGIVEILARDLDPQACESLRVRGFQVHADRALVRIQVPASTDMWEGIEAIRKLGGRLIAVTPLRSPLEQFFEIASHSEEER